MTRHPVLHDPERPQASVREDVRNQLYQLNPGKRTLIDQALSSNWLTGYRNEIARPHNLDPTDLADVTTAYVILGWTIAHEYGEDVPQATVQAVRDQMRRPSQKILE